jgi:hypothetical protein
MNDCTSLTSIDLSGLIQLRYIDNDFMIGCTSLTSIKCLQRLKNMIELMRNHLNKDINYIIIY